MTAAQISEGFRSPSNAIRFGTFCQARDFGPEAIEPAAEILFDPDTDPMMRYWATELSAVFAQEKPERSRELLLGGLADPSPLVRAAALGGLAAFPDEATILCIRGSLADRTEIPHAWDSPYTVAEAAEISLSKIALRSLAP